MTKKVWISVCLAVLFSFSVSAFEYENVFYNKGFASEGSCLIEDHQLEIGREINPLGIHKNFHLKGNGFSS